MKLISLAIVCGLLLQVAADEQTNTIPLDQIWAYEMPGTRAIEELTKDIDKRLMAVVFELSYHRAEQLKFEDFARPGFAVSGSGRSALHAAFAVFIDWGARRREFSREDEIALVFFSEPPSRYRVQIRQVSRKDHEIEIRYQLERDIGGRNFTNFALIPLGKLPVGEYNVDMRQLPRELPPIEIKLGFKPLDEEWSRNFLSKPFSFNVTENGE